MIKARVKNFIMLTSQTAQSYQETFITLKYHSSFQHISTGILLLYGIHNFVRAVSFVGVPEALLN